MNAIPSAVFTVAELVLRFWRHVEAFYVKDGRRISQVHVFRMALRPVRELYGHTQSVAFGPLALKAVRDRRLRRYGRARWAASGRRPGWWLSLP